MQKKNECKIKKKHYRNKSVLNRVGYQFNSQEFWNLKNVSQTKQSLRTVFLHTRD